MRGEASVGLPIVGVKKFIGGNVFSGGSSGLVQQMQYVSMCKMFMMGRPKSHAAVVEH